ncbi:MAG: dihydroorotate dehydrogenase, partial [Alphaproteobacteria bacterium CG11_big_fil_rev_8_21_14_0_20_44_7]
GVPIIGMGGIMCLEDALDFFEAGATAIAIGTATFANPKIMEEVILGLEKYLQGQGIKGTNEIVGAALK